MTILRTHRSIIGAALAASVSMAALATAQAQETDADAPVETRMVYDVIVTAEKREVSAQDLPASITAFDEAVIEVRGIDGFEDIALYTPGLFTYPTAANSNGLRLSLRGLGTFDPQIGLDSKVALYVDGVYLGKTQGLAFDSPDLARVEVLKGPQGTLYGRNAVGGAINLISARPEGGEFFGEVEAGYGSFDAVDLNGFVNIPLGENAGLRLSGLIYEKEGWVENNGLGENFAAEDRRGARASFGVDLSETLRFDIAAEHTVSRNSPHYYQAIEGTATPTSLFAAAVVGHQGRQDSITTNFENRKGVLYNDSVTASLDWDYADDHNLKLTAGWRQTDGARFVTLLPDTDPAILNATFTADLGGGFTLLNAYGSIPFLLSLAGETPRADFSTGVPRFPVGSFFQSGSQDQPTQDEHRQFSFEATATGSWFDGNVDYTGGIYYFNEDTADLRALLTEVNDGDAQDYLNVLAFLTPIGTGLGLFGASQNPLLPPAQQQALLAQAQATAANLAFLLDNARNPTAGRIEIDTTAFAVYGQATWHVTDRFRLTGGLRFSDEEKSAFQQSVSPFFRDTTTLMGNPILPNIGDTSFDSIDPMIRLEYDASDDVLLYASRVEAFRSGGFNAVAVAPRLPGQTFGQDFIFDQEEITAYEVGMKSELFDRRLRLNAAGFYYELANEQTTSPLDSLVQTARAIVNTDTDQWGAEVDFLAVITDKLILSGTYSWIDGDPGPIPNLLPGQTGTFTERNNLQATPENSYLISLNYNDTFANGMGFNANVDFSHTDEVEMTPGDFISARDLLSARIAFDKEMANGNEVFVAFWGRNLTDDEYTIDTLPFQTFAEKVFVYGEPRSYGVTAGVKF